MDKVENKEVEITDDEMIDVAKEANQLISAKDKEIKSLKTKLARSSLYQTVEEEEVEVFDPNAKFDYSNKTNLDIAQYAVNLYEYEVANGIEPSLGEGADQVAGFFKDLIDKSEGNPTNFRHYFQMNVAKDSPDIAKIYRDITKR